MHRILPSAGLTLYMNLQKDERIVEWIRFLFCVFRQDLQDYQDFFRLRRGVFRPKAALS